MKRDILHLPDELLLLVNQMLTFEEREAFGQTCQRLRYISASNCNYLFYDIMQISDDPKETYLFDSTGKRQKLFYDAKNAPVVLSKATNLKEIAIYMKEVDLSDFNNMPKQSPYTMGGYLGKLLGSNKFNFKFDKLKRVTLHCDMLINTIANKNIFAPFQDLNFALQFMAFQQFETSIQITLCSSQYSEADTYSRDMLVYSMQELLKTVNAIGAKTSFEPYPQEGYVDMNIEFGNLEYNFSFFYYNPDMCCPEAECVSENNQ